MPVDSIRSDASIMAAVSFAVVVAVLGGIIDWSSVRTLMGIAMVIAGPGLVASSFRDIRHNHLTGSSAAWERLLDFVLVPFIGAYAVYNIVGALPSLGGSAFPIADAAMALAVTCAIALVAKVALEFAAMTWFPERMAAITVANPPEPGSAQMLISAVLRALVFLFVSAAFVGTPWQLWVAGLLFVVPFLLAPFVGNWPSSRRLWQVLPKGLPALTVSLLLYLVISTALKGQLGDSAEYALMAFVILMIPDFIFSLLGTVGRDPEDDETVWYQRPSMAWLYRAGGVVMLGLTFVLVYIASQ